MVQNTTENCTQDETDERPLFLRLSCADVRADFCTRSAPSPATDHSPAKTSWLGHCGALGTRQGGKVPCAPWRMGAHMGAPKFTDRREGACRGAGFDNDR